MSFADFESQFGSAYETYYFYDGEIELKFDKVKHEYYRVDPEGNMILLLSGSKVGHIIDKSPALVPWACKMMAQKLFATIPKSVTKSGVEAVIMPYEDFSKAVMAAKTAHKDKLEDAGEVGQTAHNWIENYIKFVLALSDYDPPLPTEPRAESCCRAMLEWARAHNVRFLETEKKVYSKLLDVSGTEDSQALTDSCADRGCCPEEFKDRLSLVDWKTSNNLYIEYIMQLSFYWLAEQEEHGTDFDDAWVIRLGKEDGEFEPWHLDKDAVSRGQRAFRSALQLTRDVEALEAHEKARKEAISVIRKAEAEEAREARHKIACPYSSRFKGSKYPTCNQGNPCEKCLQIFVDRQVEKMFGWVWSEGKKRLEAGEAGSSDAAEIDSNDPVVVVVSGGSTKPGTGSYELLDLLPT